MDTFAGSSIARLEHPSEYGPTFLTHENLPLELRKDVTVALLDDGANFMHKAIASRLENGRSFDSSCEDADTANAPNPFHGSTTGHGTYIAYMIGQVCPHVKIFVFKMNVIRHGGGDKDIFTAKSAADVCSLSLPKLSVSRPGWAVLIQTNTGGGVRRKPRFRYHLHVLGCAAHPGCQQ